MPTKTTLLLISLILQCSWTSRCVVFARIGTEHTEKDESGGSADKNSPTTTTVLRNISDPFPLVGYGVGNLQHELIEPRVADGIRTMSIRLLDTAHASRNEHLLARGIAQAAADRAASSASSALMDDDDDSSIHVVTKVWYTYLGYERTLISVREALEQLATEQNSKTYSIRVHMLLHWPRCRTDIAWMNCADEEEALPQHVKDAGPPPHLDKDRAFLESWRALEDVFLGHVTIGPPGNNSDGRNTILEQPKVASIGVSNFDLSDMQSLVATARVTPHILQGNVWTLLFDPHLIQYCRQNEIHFQAYNVMNGIVHNAQNRAPNAFYGLVDMARNVVMPANYSDKNAAAVTVSSVVMKWLTQQGVSTIPRSTQVKHMQENSPRVVGSMPHFTVDESEHIEQAVAALLTGRDLARPKATFFNKHDEVLHIFWSSHDNEEFPVREHLQPGESFSTDTTRGHVFVAYDAAKSQRREFVVSATFDEQQEIHIDEL